MIEIAITILVVWCALAFCFGAIFGRAAGWEEGYAAASTPGEEIPAEGSPYVRVDPSVDPT